VKNIVFSLFFLEEITHKKARETLPEITHFKEFSISDKLKFKIVPSSECRKKSEKLKVKSVKKPEKLTTENRELDTTPT